MATDLNNPPTWLEWAQTTLSYREAQSGYMANFIGLTWTSISNVVCQAIVESILTRSQNASTCPDDAVPYVSAEAGLLAYNGESVAAWKLRINDKWEENLPGDAYPPAGGFWRKVGRDSTIVSELGYYLGLVGDVAATIKCDFNSPTNPLSGGGDLNQDIPPWPMDPGWYTQFIVSIHLSTVIGSGAENRSVLISNDQLNTVQAIINKVKAADWACREVIFSYGSIAYLWDPNPGLLWDPGLTWAQLEAPSSIVERYHS